MELQTKILSLLHNYATCCEYPMSFDQIHKMLTVKVSRDELEDSLRALVHKGELVFEEQTGWYTIHFAQIFQKRTQRKRVTEQKIHAVQVYLNLLSKCPCVQSVFLTGSCAFDNAKDDDDVDLMIITSPHTMFSCRIFALVLAEICGVRRRRGILSQANAACTNIWIDGSNLIVPHQKRGEYGGREIVASKMLFDSGEGVYVKFIESNGWVGQLLPNWSGKKEPQTKMTHGSSSLLRKIGVALNPVLKSLQLVHMKSLTTNEIISESQLWLHPKLRE